MKGRGTALMIHNVLGVVVLRDILELHALTSDYYKTRQGGNLAFLRM